MNLSDLLVVGAGSHFRQLNALFFFTAKGAEIIDPSVTGESDEVHLERIRPQLAATNRFFIGFGPSDRSSIVRRLNLISYLTLSLKIQSVDARVHGSAIFLDNSKIGGGSVVMPLAFIGLNVTIGDHCLINTSAIVEHDTIIGQNVHIAPGAIVCGGAEIGDNSIIGAGATVLPKTLVTKNSVVRAGSVHVDG